MQYPQRKLAVYVAVSRHDSLTIRFHQVWTGEPPYYDPEDFSSGDERVLSVIDKELNKNTAGGASAPPAAYIICRDELW